MSTSSWNEVAHRDWVVATLRAVVSSVGLLLLYYLAPIEGRPHGTIVFRLSVALVLFAVIVVLEVRAIMKSRQPMLRAGIALATILPLFLIGFAWTYLTLARSSPATFGAPLTRTDALYFTVTVFTTVGFGDITAKTQVGKVVVMIQMLSDIALIAIVIRLIVGVATREADRRGNLDRPSDAAESPTVSRN